MAYFGKEFTFEREENFEGFINSLGVGEEEAQKLGSYKPNQKVEKDGDTYKFVYITPGGNKEVSFQDGASLDEEVREGLTAKSTFTVDGNTITQVQDFGDQGTITFKREYSDNELKVTITTSKWDGEASRWYTAA